MTSPQSPALVLAHVGEQGQAVAVPDRVEPPAPALHAQPVVHREGLADEVGESDGVQPEVGGAGAPPDGHQDLVAGKVRPSSSVAVTAPSGWRETALHRAPVRTVMPSRFEGGANLVAGEGLLPGEQPRRRPRSR